MANENRLIDANEAYEIARLHHKDFAQSMADLTSLREVLEDAPTVDAVEVVRCKDCKWWSRNVGIVDSPNGHCFSHDIDTNGYDFCSYGERKGDGNA